jgi:SAM-dependent methyltransferase
VPLDCQPQEGDISDYRASPRERARLDDLLRITPSGSLLLDAGTRDGHIARALAPRFEHVVALDLYFPDEVRAPISPVQGSILELPFPDAAFDVVLCTEVLEHLAADRLECARRELRRVAGRALVIGVPYRQDTRVGRATCRSCGRHNPGWGHVNTFDEGRLESLFAPWSMTCCSYVGRNRDRTNAISARLLDYAGNPHGTYGEYHACVHCGAILIGPVARNIRQRAATRLAAWLRSAQHAFVRERPSWIHVVFQPPIAPGAER